MAPIHAEKYRLNSLPGYARGYLQSGLSLVPHLVKLLFIQALLVQGGRVTLELGLP